MANWKQHFGNYLKSEDITRPVRVIVDRVSLEDVKGDDDRSERKLVAHFGGKEKGLILNQTNCEMLSFIAGSNDYEHWHGIQCELYVDPNVKFGSRTVSGLRVRAVQSGSGQANTAPSAAPPPMPMRDPRPEPPPVTDDDMPF